MTAEIPELTFTEEHPEPWTVLTAPSRHGGVHKLRAEPFNWAYVYVPDGETDRFLEVPCSFPETARAVAEACEAADTPPSDRRALHLMAKVLGDVDRADRNRAHRARWAEERQS